MPRLIVVHMLPVAVIGDERFNAEAQPTSTIADQTDYKYWQSLQKVMYFVIHPAKQSHPQAHDSHFES